MIRVVLGHRGKLVRGALAAVLSQEADLDVVAQLEGADDALTTVAREKPQVVVLDPMLNGKMGIEELCDRLPQGSVLLLIDRDAVATKRQALLRLAPRVGSIATDASPADLADAVRHLAGGKPVLDVELAFAALQAEENPLTERECEVLKLVTTGATAQEVARQLCLSAGTVRNHLSRILAKMGARSRIEAIKKAQEAGWI